MRTLPRLFFTSTVVAPALLPLAASAQDPPDTKGCSASVTLWDEIPPPAPAPAPAPTDAQHAMQGTSASYTRK